MAANKPQRCPICDREGQKALWGPFPIRLCVPCKDPDALVPYGFWAPVAAWLDENFNRASEGFTFALYPKGASYLKALWSTVIFPSRSK